MKKIWLIMFLVACLAFVGSSASASVTHGVDVAGCCDVAHINQIDVVGFDYDISSHVFVAGVGLQKEAPVVLASKSLERGSNVDYVARAQKNDLHSMSVFLALLE